MGCHHACVPLVVMIFAAVSAAELLDAPVFMVGMLLSLQPCPAQGWGLAGLGLYQPANEESHHSHSTRAGSQMAHS